MIYHINDIHFGIVPHDCYIKVFGMSCSVYRKVVVGVFVFLFVCLFVCVLLGFFCYDK